MPDDYSFDSFANSVNTDIGPGAWQSDQYQPMLQGFGNAAGYQGDLFGEEQPFTSYGVNEGGDTTYQSSARELNPDFLSAMKGYSFRPTGQQSLGMYKGNNQISNQTYGSKDNWFDKLAMAGIPMALTGGLGGGLAGLFGGGALGSAAGYGLANAGMADFQGGNAGKGFLTGAISGGIGNMGDFSPSKLAGIESPGFANAFNRGVGTFAGNVASGKSVGDAAKAGVLGAGISGVNTLGQEAMHPLFNTMQSFLSSGSDGFDELQGSGGDMGGATDVTPSSYDDSGSNYRYGGDQPVTSFAEQPQKTAQSFSGNGLSSVLSSLGNGALKYATNNAGDLAQMLYGFYNNRRQQNALGNQINSLKGLFGNDSPYAQQLRNTLAAKAAQQGKRSNTGAREVQLQAALADRAAQMQPSLMQLNQAKGQLQNSMGSNMISMLNRTGAFNGLANMFGNSNPYGNYSMLNNSSDYNLLGPR